MRWDQTEYLLKGLYLGLLVVVGLHAPTWGSIGVLAASSAAGLWYYPLPREQQTMAGALLLLGIPGFYLLTFASFEEETEVEIAALCGALGVGLWALSAESIVRTIALVAPLLLYYIYTKY